MLNCLVQMIHQHPQLINLNRPGMPRTNQGPRPAPYNNNKMRMQGNNQHMPMQRMGQMQHQARQQPHPPQQQMPTPGVPQQQMNAMPAPQPGMPAPGMPQPNQMPAPQGSMPAPQPGMPAPGMPQPNQMPAPIPGQSSKHQEYLQKTYEVWAGVTEQNPFYKNQVGTAIYNFVVELVGQARAPKITGMIIDLPCPNIQQILSNYDNLKQKVREAQELLDQEGKPQQ